LAGADPLEVGPLRRSPSPFELPAPYHLKASTFTFQGDDNQEFEGTGYVLYNDQGEVFSRESSLRDAGLYVIRAAGITHHRDSQGACFGAGKPVRLQPDPKNKFDPKAIQIVDSTGRHQLGFCPDRGSGGSAAPPRDDARHRDDRIPKRQPARRCEHLVRGGATGVT